MSILGTIPIFLYPLSGSSLLKNRNIISKHRETLESVKFLSSLLEVYKIEIWANMHEFGVNLLKFGFYSWVFF